MKQLFALALCVLLLALLSGCRREEPLPQTPPSTLPPATEAAFQSPDLADLVMPTLSRIPVYHFTPEEEALLLDIGMAEAGAGGCVECIALVMRTVLNRVENGGFGDSIESVLCAKDQFTPVAEGTLGQEAPNDLCREALEIVKCGWDKSLGALYYEFCDSDCWHSENLRLLFQHCEIRFYREN